MMRKHDSRHRHNLLCIACAPPFATHKAFAQGGIRPTDHYYLKLNWPIDESPIESVPQFTGSTVPQYRGQCSAVNTRTVLASTFFWQKPV
jgi:hypothetical protein